MIRRLFVFVVLALLHISCASNDRILYLQNNTVTGGVGKFENTLQPDDNLMITITAAKPELANDFNLMYLNARSTEMSSSNNVALHTYLIDQNGYIDFPVLGKIKLAGLTRIQAEEKIRDLLKDYIVNAGVNLKVMNFKVSVLGEVARSGSQSVVGDRITIFEALSQAGDLTIYGKRKNITLIREKDGVKSIHEIDITDSNLINSDFYYLAHNDVIYVKPNKTRVNSSVIGPNLTVGISAISLLITIITLTTRN